MPSDRSLRDLIAEVRGCRICRDTPKGRRLPHEPRPVVRLSPSITILIAGQAPGTRVHASGLPFDDPSGDRLRAWLGLSRDEFYDETRIGFLPMGLCFPGHDAHGGDLPPRPECAAHWRARLLAQLDRVALTLLIGRHAQRWHLGDLCPPSVSETVADWRRLLNETEPRPMFVLPHPSWRNSGWLKARPWFEQDLVPELRRRVAPAVRRSVG